MDTTLAVIKRIEQQLTQLRRELQRNGFELPNEAFYVHTGDGVSVQVAEKAPAPIVKEQPTKKPQILMHPNNPLYETAVALVESTAVEDEPVEVEEQKPPRKTSK